MHAGGSDGQARMGGIVTARNGEAGGLEVRAAAA
jgi:hypothetical protein